jgi:hypothetical protein
MKDGRVPFWILGFGFWIAASHFWINPQSKIENGPVLWQVNSARQEGGVAGARKIHDSPQRR